MDPQADRASQTNLGRLALIWVRSPLRLVHADAAHNAALIREVLGGKKSARRDVVVLNAAAALVAAGRADHLRDAVRLAAGAIDSGAGLAKLEALVTFASARM